MRTVSIRLADLDRGSIPVGFAGENLHTQVRIDCKKAYEEYPAAVVGLIVKNPNGDVYPAVTVRDGDIVTWDVTNADLAYEGTGEIQLTFTVGEVVKKSYIGRIRIDKSILNPGETPDPIKSWIDQANEILEEVQDAVPEGGTTGQVLAKKSDSDRDTEWVDPGSGGTTDYDELENRPQIAGVTLTGDVSLHDLGAAAESDIPDVSGLYTKPSGGIPDTDLSEGVNESLGKADTAYQKPSGGIPAADMAEGVIPDPTSIIDDTAGDGDTNKVWSADKSSSLLTEINSRYTKPNTGIPATDMASSVQTSLNNADSAYQKPQTGIPASDLESGVIPAVPVQDVQLNGTSILNNGVANVPVADANNLGVVKTNPSGGIDINSTTNKLRISNADNSQIRTGTDAYKPITPSIQHSSVFYGLAKLAGADMAQSSNPVGTFTDDALVKIQKMLGVYEAPWELIRQETITNDTASDIEITVDGNGNPFELTDIVVWFALTGDGSQATYGDYGRIKHYYSNSDSDDILVNTITAASGVTRVFYTYVEQKNGLIKKYAMNNTQHGNTGSLIDYATSSFSSNLAPVVLPGSIRAYNKIVFRQVTGKASYKIFGKRKWN